MRKYSFNGDDRLSPQLKLIFFFFLFFSRCFARADGLDPLYRVLEESSRWKSRNHFFFSEFVSPRVSSIRELGDGGFEKEK